VNGLQRGVQRVAASQLGAAFFRTTRIDVQDRLLHRLSGGRTSVTGLFAAFPTVFVITAGARSGRPHTVPLIGVTDESKPGRIALIASNFGQAHDPDWCHNLRASPEATVLAPDGSRRYAAEEVTDQAYERWFDLGARVYVGYPSYRTRAGRHIPISS
jgi:deazaflavin-dependent oxidoreductase (nitroreductase family)